MRLTPHIVTKLLARGIQQSDPRFAPEAERLYKEEAAEMQTRRKESLTAGYERNVHLTTAKDISRWLTHEGCGVRLGPIDELEVWIKERGLSDLGMSALSPVIDRLAIRRDRTWEVYNLRSIRGVYQPASRLA